MKLIQNLTNYCADGIEVDIKTNHKYAQIEIYHVDNYHRSLIELIVDRKDKVTITKNSAYIEQYNLDFKYNRIHYYIMSNIGEKELVMFEMNSRAKGKKDEMKKIDPKTGLTIQLKPAIDYSNINAI